MLPSPAAMLQRLGSPNPNLAPNTGVGGGGPASQNISNVRELSNTNNDRLSTPTPTVAQLANSPAARASIGAIMRMDASTRGATSGFRPTTGMNSVVSKTRREQAELLMSLGEQFPDSTIPDGDPLPDVDSEATAMLLDFSSRAQSPHHQALLASAAAAATAAASASAAQAAQAAQTSGTAQAPAGHNAPVATGTSSGNSGTQKEPQLDLTRRRTLYDLTPDALLPLQGKMSGTGEAVEKWTNGPALRHMKRGHHNQEDGSRSRGEGSQAGGAGGNSGSGGASVGNGRKIAPNPWTLAALKSGQKKEYPCTQCGRVFHSRSELRHHARRYEKRPYTCDQCDRSFLYPKDLRRHKTTHTGSKQYKCRICPKSFSRKDNLRRHINNEHDKTDVPLSPSIDAMEMTGGRREGDRSEDSEDGGPTNGHGNGYPYGNGNPTDGPYHNNDSMQTDAPGGGNGHSKGDREVDKGRGGSQEQANDQDGRKTHGVHNSRHHHHHHPHPIFRPSYSVSVVPSSFKAGSRRFHLDTEDEETEDDSFVPHREHLGQKMYEYSQFHSPFLFEDGSGSGLGSLVRSCIMSAEYVETKIYSRRENNGRRTHGTRHGGKDESPSGPSTPSGDETRDNDKHDDYDYMSNDSDDNSNSSDDDSDSRSSDSDSDSPLAPQPPSKYATKPGHRLLICPFRRYKPYKYNCKSSYRTPRNLIHHLKQTHKLSFHSQCTRLFPNEDALKRHNNGRVCCRKCRTGFESKEAMVEHKGPNCEASKRGMEDDWRMLYEQSCNDGLQDLHNCYAGEDDHEQGKRMMEELYEEEIRSMKLEREKVEKDGRRKKSTASALQKGKAVATRDGKTPPKIIIQVAEEDLSEFSDGAVESQSESEGSDDLFSQYVDQYPPQQLETLSVVSNDAEKIALREANSALRQRVHYLEGQARANYQIVGELQAQAQEDANTISELRVENQRLREREMVLEEKLFIGTVIVEPNTSMQEQGQYQQPQQSSSQPIHPGAYAEFNKQKEHQQSQGLDSLARATFPPTGAISSNTAVLGFGYNPLQQRMQETQSQYGAQQQAQSQPQLGMINNTPMISQQSLSNLNLPPTAASNIDIDMSFLSSNPHKRRLLTLADDFGLDFLSPRPRKRSTFGGAQSMFSENVHDRTNGSGIMGGMGLDTGSDFDLSFQETTTVAGGESFDHHYSLQGESLGVDEMNTMSLQQWNRNVDLGGATAGPGPSTTRARLSSTFKGRGRGRGIGRPAVSGRYTSRASLGENSVGNTIMTSISQSQSLKAPTLISGPTASSTTGSDNGMATAGGPAFPFFSQMSTISNSDFTGTPTPQISFDNIDMGSYSRYDTGGGSIVHDMPNVIGNNNQIFPIDSPMRGGSTTPTPKQSSLNMRMQSNAALRGMPTPIVGVGYIFEQPENQVSGSAMCDQVDRGEEEGGAAMRELDEMLARYAQENNH